MNTLFEMHSNNLLSCATYGTGQLACMFLPRLGLVCKSIWTVFLPGMYINKKPQEIHGHLSTMPLYVPMLQYMADNIHFDKCDAAHAVRENAC